MSPQVVDMNFQFQVQLILIKLCEKDCLSRDDLYNRKTKRYLRQCCRCVGCRDVHKDTLFVLFYLVLWIVQTVVMPENVYSDVSRSIR